MAILADFGLFVPWIHSVLSMEFIPGAKIWVFTDPQLDIWLLHRILDHMTPWISFHFRGRIGFGAIVARRFMFNKLYNKLSTEFCLFYYLMIM